MKNMQNGAPKFELHLHNHLHRVIVARHCTIDNCLNRTCSWEYNADQHMLTLCHFQSEIVSTIKWLAKEQQKTGEAQKPQEFW